MKATLDSPYVGITLALSLPVSYPLCEAHGGTVASASNRLAAVFGSQPLLDPASFHLTPEGAVQGSDSHVEPLFNDNTNVPDFLAFRIRSAVVQRRTCSHFTEKHCGVQSKGHGGQSVRV